MRIGLVLSLLLFTTTVSAGCDLAGAAPEPQGRGVTVLMDDSEMTYSIARKNSDGSISRECVTGPEAAERALAAATASEGTEHARD